MMSQSLLYNTQIVGTCSLCGGNVTVPLVWLDVVPPTPTCSSCHAVEAPPSLPIIPMVPAHGHGMTTRQISIDSSRRTTSNGFSWGRVDSSG